MSLLWTETLGNKDQYIYIESSLDAIYHELLYGKLLYLMASGDLMECRRFRALFPKSSRDLCSPSPPSPQTSPKP